MKTFTSEGIAGHTPFSVQEISHKQGIYHGTNPTTGSMILVNRKQLQNGKGIFLGVSSSGKSFAVKREITDIYLSTDDDIIIIDPESEFAPLVKAFNGEVAVISTDGANYINDLEMSPIYGGEKDPFRIKSDFVMSMCEQIMGSSAVGLREKSIIDQCMRKIFEPYIRSGYRGRNPMLVDLRMKLLQNNTDGRNGRTSAFSDFGKRKVYSDNVRWIKSRQQGPKESLVTLSEFPNLIIKKWVIY